MEETPFPPLGHSQSAGGARVQGHHCLVSMLSYVCQACSLDFREKQKLPRPHVRCPNLMEETSLSLSHTHTHLTGIATLMEET